MHDDSFFKFSFEYLYNFESRFPKFLSNFLAACVVFCLKYQFKSLVLCEKRNPFANLQILLLGFFSRKWKKIANFPLLRIVNVIGNVLGNVLLTFGISEIHTQFLETVQTNLKNGFVKRSDFSKLQSFLLKQETPPEKNCYFDSFYVIMMSCLY